ncbi:hypothetical protein BCT04_09465 [Vibrio breoganii]|uniref:DUF1488 domain-containing protein n=1 Tax=Vibrio breoganii TaxID=553239 RepID=UPI000CAA9E5F|nr:DUF1488 domain-containing protein [Vibrio breoganii]PMG91613.1 hypothetical protein BCU80_12295 [Vibrio breoganii]PMK34190.1 hypothetical protein BCU03_04250 [Vibrio breoganii]PML11136.1 hypothetical protein BCT84_17085 [Vibrio breoganii]PML36811.1 hypothetical protein BCT78_09440 [Vibrio breoganii]PMM10882.1 hypothetical protein BCT61_00555 [Vibrio breoganii]
MNQSIIFTDQQSWDGNRKVVVFVGQQSGNLIECLVSAHYLENLSQLQIDDEVMALKVFSEYHFDLEDLAEELIEAEEFNQLGQIEIN